MTRTSKRLYDAFAQYPTAQTAKELLDFGLEANDRLPTFGKEHEGERRAA